MTPRPNLIRIALAEAASEIRQALRQPSYFVGTLILPLAFYAFFGLAMGARAGSGGAPASGAHPNLLARYLLGTYGAFGASGAALFAFGVGVANERALGWLDTKRASPMPFSAYFLGKLAICLAFSAAIQLGLILLGVAFGGVSLSAAQAAQLVLICAAGSLPFCALGMLVGSLATPSAAPAIVNLIHLPSAFLSGLWVPIDFLPAPIQALAHAFPGYHLAQLCLRVLGEDRGESPVSHAAFLLATLLVFGVLSAWSFRRSEELRLG